MVITAEAYDTLWSPLAQGRGLKQVRGADRPCRTGVAPHAGAWIETSSRTSCSRRSAVAPHAGAWIETLDVASYESAIRSPLTQGRGLKRRNISPLNRLMDVAPHAGAWIETSPQQLLV